jgi:hypothetical protein
LVRAPALHARGDGSKLAFSDLATKFGGQSKRSPFFNVVGLLLVSLCGFILFLLFDLPYYLV